MYDLRESSIDEIFPKRSQTAIVLGNGPSLLRFSDKFHSIIERDDVIVFGVNRIFKEANKIYRPVHYYFAQDRTCYAQYWQKIREMKPVRAFIYKRYHQVARVPRLVTFDLNPNPYFFSTNKNENMGHHYTSPVGPTQLAVMQGANKIYFFGIDCTPDKDGKTHSHGHMRRNEKQWKNICGGIKAMLASLRKNSISYEIISDLFTIEEKEYIPCGVLQ